MITVKNISPLDNFVFMQMKDGDKLLCVASASIEGEKAQLIEIKEYESGLSYDMGKSILNALDLKGVKTVTCNCSELHKTLISLRFSQSNCAYSLSLEGYFLSNC